MPGLAEKIAKFINELANEKTGELAFNQYSYGLAENEVRRNNLARYLKNISAFKPEIMLCAEAPSYRGCRLTGIPFTSRAILMDGINNLPVFGRSNGYSLTDEYTNIMKEQTATIIWNTMSELQVVPLAWNAFPFHPFKKDGPLSNRTPTNQELKTGEKYLLEMIRMFEIKQIIAVGNKAEFSLNNLGFKYQKVRHPANGGKKQFVEGITGIFQNPEE